MDLIVLFLWGILGLREDWRPDACDHVFAYDSARIACEQRRDAGRAWAEELAGYLAEEAVRWGMEDIWDWIVGDLKREYNFERGNVCPIRIPVASVVSRTLIDEEAGRWRFCWRYQAHRTSRAITNCQPVLLLGEDEEYVRLDRCAYGETGLFQLRSREIPAGYVLPWGEEIPRSPAKRREAAHDPRTNVHLGLRALAEARDVCCGEDTECRADPSRWLGAYNTGRCRGEAASAYVRRVDRERRGARAYACSRYPDSLWCQVR